MKKKISRMTSLFTRIGGPLGGVSGFAADFFMPIVPRFGLLITVFFAILTAASVCLYLFSLEISSLRRRLKLTFNENWYLPIGCTLLLTTILVYSCYYVSKNYGEANQGYLATNISEIAEIQKSLFNIEENTAKTAINTKQTAENTGMIVDKLNNGIELSSDDPRKELSAMGLMWSTYSLDEALYGYRNNDSSIIELFLAGGMAIPEPTFVGLFGKKDIDIRSLYKIISKYQKYDLNGLYDFNHTYLFYDRMRRNDLQSELKKGEPNGLGMPGGGAITPLLAAIWENNLDAVLFLREHNVDLSKRPYLTAYSDPNKRAYYDTMVEAVKVGNPQIIAQIQQIEEESKLAERRKDREESIKKLNGKWAGDLATSKSKKLPFNLIIDYSLNVGAVSFTSETCSTKLSKFETSQTEGDVYFKNDGEGCSNIEYISILPPADDHSTKIVFKSTNDKQYSCNIDKVAM